MEVQLHQEYALTDQESTAVNALLQYCFPGFPSDRNYYKSLPSFRFLIWENENLIGHISIVFRIVKVGSTVTRIFGISDVCVHPDHRSKQIASVLLHEVEKCSQKYQIDFLILIAEERALYKKRGYKSVSNTVRWLLVNDHQSLGVMHGNLDQSLMVKAMGTLKWNKGLLDLIGGLF
ncbi:MAG: putative acetyltransferase [Polaribacter sp.]|jgi:predicted acetyltransferase